MRKRRHNADDENPALPCPSGSPTCMEKYPTPLNDVPLLERGGGLPSHTSASGPRFDNICAVRSN